MFWTDADNSGSCGVPVAHKAMCKWAVTKPGAEEKSWNIPGTTDIYSAELLLSCCQGPQTPHDTSVTKAPAAAAAACLCWYIPHLPIVQKTKGYLSLEALLWYISKCQVHNLAGEGKKKKIKPPWLLCCSSACFCHTEIQAKAPPGTRLHTGSSMLGNWHWGPS